MVYNQACQAGMRTLGVVVAESNVPARPWLRSLLNYPTSLPCNGAIELIMRIERAALRQRFAPKECVG
jgi:hypothetical protein